MTIIGVICIGVASALSFHFGVRAARNKNTSTSKSPRAGNPSSSRSASAPASVSSQSFSPATATVSAVTAAILPSQVSLKDAVKPLWVHVSISTQNVTVYDANNQVVESFMCSTGFPGDDTPTGTFSVYKRGTKFMNDELKEGGYYYVAFYKTYYFHSVPIDENGNIITSVANDLGHEDSHGCVHLTVTDAKWMYDNIPNGTKVVIEN